MALAIPSLEEPAKGVLEYAQRSEKHSQIEFWFFLPRHGPEGHLAWFVMNRGEFVCFSNVLLH